MTSMIDICLVPFVCSVNYLSVTLGLYLFAYLFIYLFIYFTFILSHRRRPDDVFKRL